MMHSFLCRKKNHGKHVLFQNRGNQLFYFLYIKRKDDTTKNK
jgi:hypothetical protein